MYLFYACVDLKEKKIKIHTQTNSKQWTKLSSLSNFKITHTNDGLNAIYMQYMIWGKKKYSRSEKSPPSLIFVVVVV